MRAPALLLLLLAVLLPGSVRADPCVLDAFAPLSGVLVQEFRYITQLLLHSSLLARCHCKMRIRDRAVQAFGQLEAYHQPSVVLFAVFGVTPEELQAIQGNSEHTREKLVVFHFSDEGDNHDLTWYPLVKAVFRNYHRNMSMLKEHTQYLTDALSLPPSPSATTSASESQQAGEEQPGSSAAGASPRAALMRLRRRQQEQEQQPSAGGAGGSSGTAGTGNASRVFWMPLGYGESFVPSPSLYLETGQRRLVWSWSGSTQGKPERSEMKEAFDHEELLKFGQLHVYDWFMQDNQRLAPLTYTSLMYSSMVVPLPRGNQPEQYRLWEGLIAGTIPLALRHHSTAGLAHTELLGVKVLWLERWSEAPALVQQLHANRTLQEELQGWQAHNSRLYAQVAHTVSARMAQQLCSSSTG